MVYEKQMVDMVYNRRIRDLQNLSFCYFLNQSQLL